MELIMDHIPKFDIPRDFVAGNDITDQLLNLYGNYPCKIKAGVFILCREGTVRANINLAEYVIGPNDFVSLRPGSFIQIQEITGKINICYAAFSSDFVSGTSYFPIINEKPVVALDQELFSIYLDFFSLLSKYSSSSYFNLNGEVLKATLNVFLLGVTELYKSSRENKSPARNRDNEIVREFIRLVLDNYLSEHSVSFYAEKLGITLQHFCNTIKRATGKTALQIISLVIIMDAKAQLRSTDLPVKRIAESLGFGNQSFFNKYFKQHVGMTPYEYRNS